MTRITEHRLLLSACTLALLNPLVAVADDARGLRLETQPYLRLSWPSAPQGASDEGLRIARLDEALQEAASSSTSTSSTPEASKADAPDAATARPKDYREGIGFAGLPLLNFDSDAGVGYGVKVAMYDYGKNQKPYKTQLSVQIFMTTRNAMYHEIYYDAPNFMGTPWRIDSYLKLDRILFNNYYGLGNTAEVDYPADADMGTEVGTECGTDQACMDAAVLERTSRLYKYYSSYDKWEPKLIVNLRRNLSGPFKLFSGLQAKYTIINPHTAETIQKYADITVDPSWQSYLLDNDVEEYGDKGGFVAYVQGGMIVDTRDEEASPKSGIFSEASVRIGAFASADSTEQAGHAPVYGGLNLTTRHYLSILPFTVFASRVMTDMVLGDAPFFEYNQVGGSRDYSAIGGSTSARGITSNRFTGRVKLNFSPELRFTPLEFYIAGTQKINLGIVAFSDMGRVWEDFKPEGSFLDFHVSVGGGLRIAWNDNFLIRADYGQSITDVDTITGDPLSGLYITFNHAF